MVDMYDIELEAMNKTRNICCDGDKCNKRYWEACTGIRESFGRIEGCAVAVSKYYAILNRLRKELWNNGE